MKLTLIGVIWGLAFAATFVVILAWGSFDPSSYLGRLTSTSTGRGSAVVSVAGMYILAAWLLGLCGLPIFDDHAPRDGGYSFVVALRFWHPSIRPDEITAKLDIQPAVAQAVDQPRGTPKGTPLPGNYGQSYWHADYFKCARGNSQPTTAEDAVRDLLGSLASNEDFLRTMHATGGRGLIHVSSYAESNYALDFSPELLEKCSRLALGLAHEVFIDEQRW